MKQNLIRLVTGSLLLLIGFVGGRLFQHAKTGYHYQVDEQKDYDSPMGSLQWRRVTETVGMPFLDPGTTIIDYNGRTIYKAHRIFQESYPYAQNIVTVSNAITWDDGEYHFHLTIETNSPAAPDK